MSIITAKDLRITRWTLSGASATAQGADGVGELARTAYAAMLAAKWEEGGTPSIPVHEYDRSRPAGDAYRATYGYDAETRSERSCCGAVCYVLKIPSGANGAPPSIALDVIGDRYVESNIVNDAETGGVCIGAFASDSSTPLAFEAEVAAATASAEHICVPATVDSQGRAIRPNDRQGVTENVVLAPSGTGAYVHILLRMADYTAFRGAWIEGGALASIDTLAATWEAEVAPDGTTTETLVPLSPYDLDDTTDANRSHGDLYFAAARGLPEPFLSAMGDAEAKAAIARLFDAAGVGCVGAIHPTHANLAGVNGTRSSNNALIYIKAFGSVSWREGCTFWHRGQAATAISFGKALDVDGRFTLAVGVWRVPPPPYLFFLQQGTSYELSVPDLEAWPDPAAVLSLCRGRADSVSLDFYNGNDYTTAYPLTFERLGYAELSSALAANTSIALDRPLPLGEHTTIAVTILPVAVSAFDSGNWTTQAVTAVDLGNFTLHFG